VLWVYYSSSFKRDINLRALSVKYKHFQISFTQLKSQIYLVNFKSSRGEYIFGSKMPSKKKGDIFDYFDEMIRQMEEEFEELEKEFFKAAGKGEVKTFGPYVYGFSMTIGPDGKPIIEEFGNVKRLGSKPILSEEREPLVDVIEKGDEVRVVAEVPGVDKNNIKVRLNGKTLILSAQEGDKKYYKEIELPTEVDENSAKATYKNGVLEIVFKKAKVESGKEIKIE